MESIAGNAEQFKQSFREEAREILAELETALLELNESPGDPEVVGRIFRGLHTIKGSGAMFGFERMAAFTHDLETAFDLVRNGRLEARSGADRPDPGRARSDRRHAGGRGWRRARRCGRLLEAFLRTCGGWRASREMPLLGEKGKAAQDALAAPGGPTEELAHPLRARRRT